MFACRSRIELSVRVPRGAAGDLEGGVRSVLEDVDGVESVEIHGLCGVRPEALDLRVDVDVTVAFEDAVDDPAGRLRDGFGVLEASSVTST